MGPQSARAAREDEHGAAVHHVAPHHRPGGKRVLEVAVSRVMHHDRRRPQGHRSLLLASAVAPASAGPCPLPAGASTRARYRERTNGPNQDTGRMSDPKELLAVTRSTVKRAGGRQRSLRRRGARCRTSVARSAPPTPLKVTTAAGPAEARPAR